MFTRRWMGGRGNRRGIGRPPISGGSSPPVTDDIVGSTTLTFSQSGTIREAYIWETITGAVRGFRSDLGITQAAGVLSQWDSQVAGGGNLAQGTAAQKPGYTASDANWGNKPSVNFAAASDDNLDSSLAASAFNAAHDGTGWTLLIVVRPSSAGAGTQQRVWNTSAGAASRGLRLLYNLTNTRFECVVSDGTADVITATATVATAPADANYAILVTHKTTTTPNLTLYYPVGTSRATGSGTPSASDAANTLSVGCTPGATSADYTGDEVEIVEWPFEASAGQRTTIGLYTVAFWGA